MWFQCTKGHKWWVQDRADVIPSFYRDGIQVEIHGEPFSLCLWCVEANIGLVSRLEPPELSEEEKEFLKDSTREMTVGL